MNEPPRSYQCAQCGGTFDSPRTDAEANREAEHVWALKEIDQLLRRAECDGWRIEDAKAEIDRLRRERDVALSDKDSLSLTLRAEIDRLTKLADELRKQNITLVRGNNRLAGGIEAIETLYATRGWSDGFRERLRQILDGVNTP